MNNILEMIKNEKVEWKKLKEIAQVSGAGVNKKILEDEKNVILLNYMDVYKNLYLTSDIPKMIVTAPDRKINECDVRYGDIFITPSSETTEDIFRSSVSVENMNNVVYSYHILRIRLNKANIITSCYLNYLFSNEDFRKNIYKVVYGNTRKTITKGEVENLVIPLPSLEIQEKIVKILDKFTNYVTELQTELQAREKQYTYYRDKLLSEEYLDELSEKIEEFNHNNEIKWSNLGNIAKIVRGASPRPISKYITNTDDGVPWIRIGDIDKDAKYVVKTAQKITIEGAKKSRILSKGDFIISNSMSYGRPYILKIDGAIHDGWAAISGFKDHIDSDFLYHYLLSDNVQKYWSSKINSSSVSNLNINIISSLKIPLPSLSIQKNIAKILDKFQDLIDNTKGLLPQEIEQREKQYVYYREKLLTFDTDSVNTHTHTHTQLISNSYFVLLEEAGKKVGAELRKEVEWKKLNEVSYYSKDRITALELNEENYVGVDNLLKDKQGKKDSNYVPKDGNFTKFSSGDILIGNIRPYLRKIWQSDREGGTNGDVLVIQINKRYKNIVSQRYLFHVLADERFFIFNIKNSKGAKMPRGDKKQIMNYKIPVPSLAVQEHVVNILDKFETLVNDIRHGLPKEIELREKQYEYYRNKLLNFPKPDEKNNKNRR